MVCTDIRSVSNGRERSRRHEDAHARARLARGLQLGRGGHRADKAAGIAGVAAVGFHLETHGERVEDAI